MKRYALLGPLAVLAFSLISVTGCSGGGTGCGQPSEEDLDAQARSNTQRVITTCGPGTHLEGTVCMKNTP